MKHSAQPRCCRRLTAATVVLAAALLLLAAQPAAAGPMPFIVPDGAVKLWSDDFDAPRYNVNSTLWARVTGKPDWQLQVRGAASGFTDHASMPAAHRTGSLTHVFSPSPTV